ncbi:para-nitrobenzyl esterase-like [Sycon ciliatum]|uniref:para-nitrobenzyl esterase-like n=1 Tax=Sycon ciliatum TaxID=27933 RepID=UPI0031F5F075
MARPYFPAIVLLLATTISLLTRAESKLASDEAASPTASIHCGEVKGTMEEGAAVFKGIPYGKAPTDERRWKPSSLLDTADGSCWNGTWDAAEYGSECMQMNGGPVGSEDCLFINVITYNLQTASASATQRTVPGSSSSSNVTTGLLPVLVWIHGGGEMSGSGGDAGYTPTPVFARNTGVVAVSLNYRLNVFGFLSLDVLNEGNGSGNYGFYDQILGLSWVQQNIEAFGGDKSQVTILGQSGGGTSVVAILSSPLANGLFHRAVVMSASTTINATMEEANKDNQVFLTGTGCSTAACLRNTSAETLMYLIPFNVYPYWNGGDAWDLPTYGVIVGKILVVDGVLIPEPSLDVIAQGKVNDVPIVIGSAGQENDIAPPVNVRYYSWKQYDDYVQQHMNTFKKDPAINGTNVYRAVSQLYPHDMATPDTGGTCVTGTPEYLLTSMTSDIRITCPTHLLAQFYAAHFKSDVYNYAVVQCPSVGAQEGGARYAYHTWGLYALFNFTFPADPRWQPDTHDWQLVTVMQAWFSRFARGQPPHPDWKTAEHGTFNLLYKPVMRDVYHKAQCDFFNQHDFIPYRWQN